MLDQAGDCDLEIIVVDDCSTDNSCDIVTGIGDERVMLKRQRCNKGPAAARNVGIELATGKYLAFLDADDYWEPEFLARTVSFLERHEKTVAVSVGQIHKSPGKRDSIAPKICAISSLDIKEQVIDDFWSFWAEHNHICTGSVLIRTGTAKRTGGQREDMRILEDWEYWGLLSLHGKWGFIPDVLFVSDGGVVTKKQGWAKYKRRWINVPTVNQWYSRLQLLGGQKDTGLVSILEKVCLMTTFSMVMEGRYLEAKRNMTFVTDSTKTKPFGKLMKRMSNRSDLIWTVFCYVLRIREYAKFVRNA